MRDMSAKVKATLALLADKTCPECDGEGWVSISWNNNPDRCEDIACNCVQRNCEPVDDEAWSGGFAENH